ncbi:ATP-binding protein [Myxococcus sp. Y35]|uniref:sensor histidine kinase n=1 Tax=Pseudomyxococcus flavus TaxID=3115648 RepID=UPI003CEC89D5
MTTVAALGQAEARWSGARGPALLEAILQASPVAIHLLDLDGTVRLWNPAAERLFGWPQDEVLGRRVPWVPDIQWEAFHRHLEEVSQGQTPPGLELALHRRDGTPLHVELWTSRVPSASGPAQCLGMLVDLTERRRNDAFRRLLSEAGDVLGASLEQDATLEHLARLAVPAHAESCRVYLEDAEGRVRCVVASGLDARVADLDGEPRTPAYAVVSRVIASGEAELHRGPPSWLCVPLGRRGQPLGALAFTTRERAYDARDVTMASELARRAALALDHARRYQEALHTIRAREELLAIASHELKSPVSALQLQLHNLRALLERSGDAPPRERIQRGVDLMGRLTKRQALLIDTLLDVSRIHAGKLELRPEPMDLEALVREVAERFEPELASSGSRLTLTLSPDSQGHWDRLRLDQVLTNLLSNALKYGRGNPVHVELTGTAAHVRLDVRDGGIGIAPERLPHLFHRFERAAAGRAYEGVGLGLWIVRQMVEAMGGDITVDSELDVGSTFTVRLPRQRG